MISEKQMKQASVSKAFGDLRMPNITTTPAFGSGGGGMKAKAKMQRVAPVFRQANYVYHANSRTRQLAMRQAIRRSSAPVQQTGDAFQSWIK